MYDLVLSFFLFFFFFSRRFHPPSPPFSSVLCPCFSRTGPEFVRYPSHFPSPSWTGSSHFFTVPVSPPIFPHGQFLAPSYLHPPPESPPSAARVFSFFSFWFCCLQTGIPPFPLHYVTTNSPRPYPFPPRYLEPSVWAFLFQVRESDNDYFGFSFFFCPPRSPFLPSSPFLQVPC